ncbi:hypothetical protein B0T20DRAFT_500696 [Sordaria brevicollis]|uniref:Uncharacterized protein n=1 Tax=Sordaria brevicollis TaxID=83679 RepID=A0AAE0PBZ6_SORBR|nr:hypothetical protein B0T20DRAFT_500696 [Sordaria brevicollis]
MLTPKTEMSAPSRAAVLEEIQRVDGVIGGGPFPTFRGRATTDPRPDTAQGQARGSERQLAPATLAIRQRSRTPSRPQRPHGLDAVVEEGSVPPMRDHSLRPPNPPFAHPGFDTGRRGNRSRSGSAGHPQHAPPRGFLAPPSRQPPRDARSPYGGQHMGQPTFSAPGALPPPIPQKSALRQQQQQQQSNRRPSAPGSSPTMPLNQAVSSRSSPLGPSSAPPPPPPPAAAPPVAPTQQPQVSRPSEGHPASSSSRPPVPPPPFEDDVFKGHLNPTNPYGYTQPPGFRHNWDTPARERGAGITAHNGREGHPFQGPPTGSRPRPSNHHHQQPPQHHHHQQTKAGLPSSSSHFSSSLWAGQAGHPAEPSGYFDLSSPSAPGMQAQPGNNNRPAAINRTATTTTTTSQFGYQPMMSPYEAEAASGMARAQVESPKKKTASTTPGGDHWASGYDVLSPVEAAVACADNRRATIFMDMGVQYADDHHEKKNEDDKEDDE